MFSSTGLNAGAWRVRPLYGINCCGGPRYSKYPQPRRSHSSTRVLLSESNLRIVEGSPLAQTESSTCGRGVAFLFRSEIQPQGAFQVLRGRLRFAAFVTRDRVQNLADVVGVAGSQFAAA